MSSCLARRLPSVAVLLLVTLLPPPAAAQDATVGGTVRDQRGAPVEGARVRVGDGTAATDAEGRFRLPVTSGAPLRLEVAAVGFAPEQVAVPALRAAERREVAVTLRPLLLLDALTVTASRARPLLNTEDAATGGSLEAEEIAALPTDARDPLSLLWNVPGVAQAQAFFGDAPPLSINGSNALYTPYLLDGLDNTEGFLGGPRVQIPLTGLARMDVLVNTYSTAYGRSANGVVDLTTRGGSDRPRQELLAFWRPGRPLDARAAVPFGGVPEAVLRQQEGFRRLQVGGAASGPLVRGRTFYSAAAELTDEREDRIGSTALAPFLGTEDRTVVKLFGRLDHGWSPTQTTTLRVAASTTDRAGTGSGVLTPEADLTTRRVGTLTALTHRSSVREGTAANVATVQVGTFRWNFPPTASDFTRPQVTIVSPALATQAVVGSSNFVFDERELQLQLRDVVEWQVGARHSLRAGADVVGSRFRLRAAGTNPLGSYVVQNNGDIGPGPDGVLRFDDIPRTAQVLSYTVDARPQQVDLTQLRAGAFVEDRWRVSPSLLLMAGVRWDFDDLTTRGAGGGDWNNVQPRLSVNWYRTPTQVIRGGAGLYAGTFPYAMYSDAIQLGADGNATVTFAGSDAPAFLQGPTPAELAARAEALPPREVFALFARGLQQPLSYQGALGTQVQLGRDWAVSVDGVWVETRNLPRLLDLNPVSLRVGPGDVADRPCASATECPADAFRPEAPTATGYRRRSTADAGGRGRYRALYVQVRRRLSDAWTVDANYTWSRAQNDTEDINFSASQANCFGTDRRDVVTGQPCTSDEWADANNDRRHRLTVRGVGMIGGRLRVSVIGDVQSGLPANRLAGAVSPDGAARFDLLGAGPIRGNGFLGNGDRFFGVPRNGERLPGYATLNVGLAYRLPLPAGDVELRADVFNALDATEVGGFVSGLGGGGSRTQFGRPGDPILPFTVGAPRQVQLSVRWAR